MKIFLKPALAAGIALSAIAAPVAIAPAFAQAAPTIGVVNAEAVLRSTDAYRAATTQRPTTYKAQIDAYNARRAQIAAQLQPMVTKLQADAQAANANQQALAQQQATIQQLEAAGQQELQQMIAPVMLSQAYVEEQIADKFPAALEATAKKKKVTLIVSPDSVLYADAALNLNQDVLAALNTAIPTAQLVPPEGWLPREMREQQAAAQAQQAGAAAPAAAPSTAAPVQGR
ncbi:MAG: OmpH family outer membrane protein [Croceibacterium sp.]